MRTGADVYTAIEGMLNGQAALQQRYLLVFVSVEACFVLLESHDKGLTFVLSGNNADCLLISSQCAVSLSGRVSIT